MNHTETTCVSIDEQVKRMWCTYKQYYCHKKEEMLPSATTWMNTEGSMLSETSQRKTSTIRISLICGILKKKKKKDFKYREQIAARG